MGDVSERQASTSDGMVLAGFAHFVPEPEQPVLATEGDDTQLPFVTE